ncbi:MAG: hypothetical protein AAB834_01925, partial [Patescibacteria group bacterium]
TSLVRYEEYSVETSARGVEGTVREWGAKALVGFDQGTLYTLWAHQDKTLQQRRHGSTTSPEEVAPLLDAIYSYFRDCGGQLRIEDLRGFNELLNQLIRPADPNALWVPTFVPQAARPTIAPAPAEADVDVDARVA